MSPRLHLRNGRVICPAQGLDRRMDVFLADGAIAGIDTAPDGFHADDTLDADGLLVLPGLVDLGANLREPGARHKADIASELRAAAAGGITTVCASPATQPVVDNTAVLEQVRNRAAQADASRLTPFGALTAGLAGEELSQMAALRDAGCVAVSDGGRPVASTLVLRRAMEYATTQGLPLVITPRDGDLSAGGAMHEGWMATRLGVAGIPRAAETVALARTLALVEDTGARVHFARLSSASGVAMVAQARAEGLPVSADVAMHQLFLTEMDVSGFNSVCRVEPPLRGKEDRDALRRALADGTIQAVCSDHQPHDTDAKAAPFVAAEPGISGLDTFLGLALRLEDEGLLSLPAAVERITAGPAALLGLPGGSLRPGAPADVCLVDPAAPWWVTPEALHSRGLNTPFIGWELTGRVRATVVAGRLVQPPAPEPA
ncbi:MAG: dihydroorotase [Ectothiorhodospiraceae bacterium]